MSDAESVDWRAQFLADVAERLQDIPAPEALENSEEDPEATPTLYTLFGELAALRQELRLQNREQSRSTRATSACTDELVASRTSLEKAQATILQQHARGELQSVRLHLTPFLDVRDALLRGLAQARQRPTWWQRLTGTAASQEEHLVGYEAIVRSFDRALGQAGVTPIDTARQIFDPHKMIAIAIEDHADVADGTALREARGGFSHGDTILRHAEVIVNKAKSKGNTP